MSRDNDGPSPSECGLGESPETQLIESYFSPEEYIVGRVVASTSFGQRVSVYVAPHMQLGAEGYRLHLIVFTDLLTNRLHGSQTDARSVAFTAPKQVIVYHYVHDQAEARALMGLQYAGDTEYIQVIDYTDHNSTH
jgi:hypothetical protein